MRQVANLKDGTEVRIRSMRRDDLDKSLSFFRALPDKDKSYARRDVTKRDVVAQRIREARSGRVRRVVALIGEKIVADGALELGTHGWKEHVGEVRLVVAKPYRRKGLGRRMARALYSLAASEKVEEIVVSMMRPQKAARAIFRKLGFREEILMPDHVKDLTGRKQDLVLMRCDLEALWQELESYMEESDWQRTR